MPPAYDLNKIKFAIDQATWQRAVALYESGKVMEVSESFGDYTAVVVGTKPYRVSVPDKDFKRGYCSCYLGERDILCKHLVALAIHAVMDGRPLKEDDKQQTLDVKCSGKQGILNAGELDAVKKAITDSLRCIKPYNGPSRTWFANQDSLTEGCNRLAAVVSGLPVAKQTAGVLVKLLLRLDKKLMVGGVDDSNGIVGGFMSQVVDVLMEYVRIDRECGEAFEPLAGRETCFGWEEPLMRILDETGGIKQRKRG